MFFLFPVWNIIQFVPPFWVCWQYGVLLLYNLSNWLFFLLFAITGLINSVINPPTFGAVETARCFLLLLVVPAHNEHHLKWWKFKHWEPSHGAGCKFCVFFLPPGCGVVLACPSTVTTNSDAGRADVTARPYPVHGVSHQVVGLGGASSVWVQGFVGSCSFSRDTTVDVSV